MAGVTVAQLADVIGVTADKLLNQLQEAGLSQKKLSDTVTNYDKQVLLVSLRAAHGGTKKAAQMEIIYPPVKNDLKAPDPNEAFRLARHHEWALAARSGPRQIKEERPRVFISYSYDSVNHVKWVANLALMLRTDGINAILDKWFLHPGDPTTEFMETGIRDSKFVLIVCTENYKRKSDARIGGVGYEEAIISSDMFANSNHRKFIPILRSTNHKNAIPTALHSKMYIDFSEIEAFGDSYRDLLLTLYGRRPPAPPIGSVPDEFRS